MENKAIPVIRQTKTSLYRLLKANYLLPLDGKVDLQDPIVQELQKPPPFIRTRSVRLPKKPLQRTQSVKERPCSTTTFKTSTPTAPKHQAMPFNLTPPEKNLLCDHLSEWLLSNVKSCHDFKHILGFVKSTQSYDAENKENVDIANLSESYEDLCITKTARQGFDLEKLAGDALADLHRLILQGYPFGQCEAWLELIHDKYHALERCSEYWVCRALIELNRDNITTAVEYFRTAIIYGAEVDLIEHLLEQLLNKYNLLNVNSEKRGSKKHAQIVNDARKIFKSSIIECALKERKFKTKELLPDILDTPTRRN